MPIAAQNTVNTLLQMSQQAANRRDNLQGAFMEGEQATTRMQMGLLQAMMADDQFSRQMGMRESHFARELAHDESQFGRRMDMQEDHFGRGLDEQGRQHDENLGQRQQEHTDMHSVNVGHLNVSRAQTAHGIRQDSMNNTFEFMGMLTSAEDTNQQRRLLAERYGVDPGPDADISAFVVPFLQQEMFRAMFPMQGIGGGFPEGAMGQDQGAMNLGGMLQQAFPSMAQGQDGPSMRGPVQGPMTPGAGGDSHFDYGVSSQEGLGRMHYNQPPASEPGYGGALGIGMAVRDFALTAANLGGQPKQEKIAKQLQSGDSSDIDNTEFIHQMDRMASGNMGPITGLLRRVGTGRDAVDYRKQQGGQMADTQTRLKIDLDRQRFQEDGMDPQEAHEKAVRGSADTKYVRYYIADDRLDNIQNYANDWSYDIASGNVGTNFQDSVEALGLRRQISSDLAKIRDDIMGGEIHAFTSEEKSNLIRKYNRLASIFHDREEPYHPLNIISGQPDIGRSNIGGSEFFKGR